MSNYLYNGVELPALPEWDEETYPFAYIRRKVYEDGSSITILVVSDTEFIVSSKGLGSDSLSTGVALLRYILTDDGSSWEQTVSSGVQSSVIWANYDVYYGDSVEEVGGTLYLAASDPVPVTTLDPTALFMGWLAGKLMAAMLGKSDPIAKFSTFIFGWFIPAPVIPVTPTITQNLSGEYSYEQGTTADTLTIVAEVSDEGALTYQWYQNGTPIDGATSASYTPLTDTEGSATYYCVVTNTIGDLTATVQSESVTVTVTVPVVPEEPDEPTTIADMVLYPNVILPDINTVWTDKETYPYASIGVDENGTVVYLTSIPLAYNAEYGLVGNMETCAYAAFCIQNEAWVSDGNGENINPGGVFFTNHCYWASYDILNTDGTTYLEAFTPVSTGNGMVCYKGVTLPNIDTVWTDKTTYPYAVLIETDVDGSYTLLYMEHKVIRRLDSTFGFAEGSAYAYSCRVFMTEEALIEFCDSLGITLEDAYAYGMKIGEWFVMTDMTAETVAGGIIWTSHDILNADGTTYLEATEPVPIAYTYDDEWPIEWNSLAVANNPSFYDDMQLVKVSNLTPTVNDFNNCPNVSFITPDGEELTLTLLATQEVPDYYIVAAAYADTEQGVPLYAYSCSQAGSFDGITIPEPGLYVTDYSVLSPDVSIDFRMVSNNRTTFTITPDSVTEDSVTYTYSFLDDKTVTLMKISDAIMTEEQIRNSSVIHYNDDGTVGSSMDTIKDWCEENNGYVSEVVFTQENNTYFAAILLFIASVSNTSSGFQTGTTFSETGTYILVPDTGRAEYILDMPIVPYSYNGVELPDINTVWIGEMKAQYPYAYIMDYSDFGMGYVLGLYRDRAIKGDIGVISSSDGTTSTTATYSYIAYTSPANGSRWSETESKNGSGGGNIANCVWCSDDILNADGSVYFAASDPIPVYE